MGAKALPCFDIVTTLALVIGLAVANWLNPSTNLPMDLGAYTAVAAVKAKTGWEIARWEGVFGTDPEPLPGQEG